MGTMGGGGGRGGDICIDSDLYAKTAHDQAVVKAFMKAAAR